MGKDEAKQKIAELVTKYEKLTPSEIKNFNEAQTKQGFIDPLFRALGWDFEDINEVSPEEKASGGRVDYAFKLNSVSIFFIEAKPLKADLTNIAYIKQAVTYAYNKGVTWALLTDFETLVVYVAQTGKPFISLTCNKYLDAFDDLWLLSKESFQNNALAEKAERYGALPQRMGIEQRLFKQLRQWREELSTQLHSYNKTLSVKQIDEVIQRLFNRLIFIRTCEDRGIEERVLLSAVHEWVRIKRKGELIEKLREIFLYFDLGTVGSISQTARPHAISKAQSNIILARDIQQTVILLIERIFTFVMQHPANEESAAPGNYVRDPALLLETGDCRKGNTAVDGYKVRAVTGIILNSSEEVVGGHFNYCAVFLDSLDTGLVNRHRAYGPRAGGDDSFPDGRNITAGA